MQKAQYRKSHRKYLFPFSETLSYWYLLSGLGKTSIRVSAEIHILLLL